MAMAMVCVGYVFFMTTPSAGAVLDEDPLSGGCLSPHLQLPSTVDLRNGGLMALWGYVNLQTV